MTSLLPRSPAILDLLDIMVISYVSIQKPNKDKMFRCWWPL